MNLSRTSLALGGLLIGVVLGGGGAYVWTTKPTWFPTSGAGSAQHESGKDGHGHGASGHGDEHDEDAHAGHEEREGQGEHEEGVVKLTAQAMRTGGVVLAEADGGVLARTITLPGEVTANADRVAHIVPRVAGIVQEVRTKLGDRVEPGELMAVLDSRELAEAKAECLAAAARETLAQTTLSRAQALFEKKITPEEELLKARQQVAEAGIEHRTAEARLHAFGVSEDQVAALHADEEKDIDFPRYEIKAPFAGTVIEKHITLGELVDTEHNIFTVADLSSVWVDVTLYTHDLPHLRVGKEIVLTADGIDGQTRGTIAYVSPTVSEATRTGFARAVVANPDLMWRPGLFCTAAIVVDEDRVDVLVPNSALQTIANQAVVFVEDGDGFRKQPVIVGRTNGTHSEILSGLVPGDRYVVKGAFLLKSELGKSEMGHDH